MVSETFILSEILALERLGLSIEIFPLVRERERVVHPEAQRLVQGAHYSRVLSLAVASAQLRWLRRRPVAYLRAWWRALSGNRSSPGFFARSIVIVPLAAHFAEQMERLGIEHMHAHWATHPTLTAYVVRELTGIPYSFTAHAHDIYVQRPMLREKVRRASFVVTISGYNRRLLERLYGAQAAAKIHVVPPGIDFEVFSERATRRPGEPFTIACVASLQDYKGHPVLLDACALLAAEGLEFRCVLIGEGEDRPRITEQIAALGLQDRVSLLGAQTRQRVSELLAQADTMVLPSIVTASGKMEGMPNALIEAMAMGLPVVATAISGVPELIDDARTGLLVPQRSPEALAAALRRLHDDPDFRARLGAAGRDDVLRRFDLRANALTLKDLLLKEPAVRPEP